MAHTNNITRTNIVKRYGLAALKSGCLYFAKKETGNRMTRVIGWRRDASVVGECREIGNVTYRETRNVHKERTSTGGAYTQVDSTIEFVGDDERLYRWTRTGANAGAVFITEVDGTTSVTPVGYGEDYSAAQSSNPALFAFNSQHLKYLYVMSNLSIIHAKAMAVESRALSRERLDVSLRTISAIKRPLDPH